MTRPTDEQLLAFLDETLDDDERAQVLEQLSADPELAAELEGAAAGLEALRSLPRPVTEEGSVSAEGTAAGRGRISSWWLVVVAATTLAVSIPVTLQLSDRGASPAVETSTPDKPANPEFVLVLRGRWSDDIQLEPSEFESRLGELREWISQLATDGVLLDASDLALEQGVRFGPPDAGAPGPDNDPEYVVGILTLKIDAYHDALAVARSCPHLRFGGSVTVRRVGAGFFTVRGKPDFTS